MDEDLKDKLDAVIGGMSALNCAIGALVATHPDPESFKAEFDLRVAIMQQAMLNGPQSDVQIEAMLAIRDHVKALGEFIPLDDLRSEADLAERIKDFGKPD